MPIMLTTKLGTWLVLSKCLQNEWMSEWAQYTVHFFYEKPIPWLNKSFVNIIVLIYLSHWQICFTL
jgi:hypothetical protein